MHNHVIEYYNQYDEDGRLISRHGQVEFLTTMRYIEKFIQYRRVHPTWKNRSNNLENTFGTGRLI